MSVQQFEQVKELIELSYYKRDDVYV